MRNFQRAQGLTIDGLARPGGETERSLNDYLATQPSVAAQPHPAPRNATVARESPADSRNDFLERNGETGGTRTHGYDARERLPSPRLNSIAVVRAKVEHERARLADSDVANIAPTNPVSGVLGNNPITGKPFRLQALGENAASPHLAVESAPPTDNSGAIARLAKLALQYARRATPRPTLTLDEQERILTEHGLRYRPDPLGRIGLGDWLDANGRVIAEDERRQMLSGSYSADAKGQPIGNAGATAVAENEGFRRGRNGLVERLKEIGRSETSAKP
jgi:hypothetical protein